MDLADLDAVELLAAFRAHELCPVEATAAVLARIAKLDPRVNAKPRRRSTTASTSAASQRLTASPAGQATRLADHAQEDWIIPHHRWSCYEMVERACGLAGFAPHAVAEATTSPPNSPSSQPVQGSRSSPIWAAWRYPNRSCCID